MRLSLIAKIIFRYWKTKNLKGKYLIFYSGVITSLGFAGKNWAEASSYVAENLGSLDASTSSWTIENKYLKINMKEKFLNDKAQIEKEYNKWLKNYARTILKEVTEEYHKPLSKYKIKLPEIEIRKMKSRWGSCLRGNNKIIYNLNLIKAPICCVEYVALHELSHMKYKNHDERFYNFMTIFMPDWKERKKLLDEEFGGIG